MALEDLKEQESEESEPVEIESVVSEPEDSSSPQEDNALLSPASDIDQVVSLYDQFEEIKTELIQKEDRAKIQGNWYINKSGWRKIATAFNLSVETIQTKMWLDDGVVKARAVARASAPNGKTATSVGMCASNEAPHMERVADEGVDESWMESNFTDPENTFKIDGAWRRIKKPKEVKEHNILTTAETRAKNRAISDCVGGGEVSAEEVAASKEDVLGE